MKEYFDVLDENGNLLMHTEEFEILFNMFDEEFENKH